MIQEQLGFALNRLGHRDRAAAILTKVIADYGNSSETNGLLGRIFKDQWIDATKAKKRREARGHLRRAIKAYQEGFLVDPRDSYPGINAVTLLEVEGSEESQREKGRLLPVVRYAVERRIQTSKNIDYWDHATLLELSVLERSQGSADRHIDDALAVVRETWEPKTTANNLRMIQGARPEADEDGPWLAEIIQALIARAKTAG